MSWLQQLWRVLTARHPTPTPPKQPEAWPYPPNQDV